MSRLLFIFERDMPTVSITRDAFSHLGGYDEIQSTFLYLTDVKPEDIDRNDVIVLMRPNNVYAWSIAEAARNAGHTAVTFCDDDLLHLPASAPSIPWRKKGLRRALEHCDVIWTPSRRIAEQYRELTAGKRSALIDTIVRPEELEGIETAHRHEDVRIVYAAAPSHAELFERLVKPALPMLAEEFGDTVSLTFVSVHPQLGDIPGIRCQYAAGMPLMEYRRFMREGEFDIGLAPLYHDDFSKCKYFNKFIEYTTQGIVGIYSNTEPYTYVVQDRENGFLADDDAASWLDALRRAVSDEKRRKACLEQAVQHLSGHHSEQACIEKVREGLPEILEAGGDYRKCREFRRHKLLYYLSRPFDWCYLVWFYLKHTGIRAVIDRTKRHFVEAKAYRRRNTKA